MARLMVMQYGMSDKLGPLTFGGGQQSLFLKGNGISVERDFGEDTARTIDEEVRSIVDRMYDRVRGLMTAKKAVLVAAAAELKQRETIEGDRLRQLLAGTAEEVAR
jgi:cell division protease FtsH